MSYGIKAVNENGIALIDDEYPGFVALGKFSVQQINVPGCSGWDYRKMWYVDIESPAMPVVFLQIPNTSDDSLLGPALGIYSLNDLGNGSYRVVVAATINYTPPAGCVHAFISDKHAGPSDDRFAMRVYNAAQDLVFDSGRERLNAQKYDSFNTTLWINQPHVNASSYGTPDNYYWWYYDVPTDTPSILDVGSYTTGQHANYQQVPQIGLGQFIMIPLWYRTGARLKFGYKHVLCDIDNQASTYANPPYTINKIKNGFNYYWFYGHRTPNKRWVMFVKPIK